MIGLAGSKADPVMVHTAAHCVRHEVPFAVMDLVDVASRGSWSLTVPPGPDDYVSGDEDVRLADLSGIYVRAIRLGDDAAAHRWRGLVDGFTAWLLESPVPVVNTPRSHVLNSYKPAHYAWLAEHCLAVPASVMTSRAEVIAEFLTGGRAVVKPLCGTRATTRELDLDRLVGRDDLGGPVMVQRLVEGDDVRVHVIGGEVVACRFRSEMIDYRSDRSAERFVTQLPDDLAHRLVGLTAEQGLAFAGWDFKVDADERYWVLECNPMPGYSFYDRVAAGAIADALVRYLST